MDERSTFVKTVGRFNRNYVITVNYIPSQEQQLKLLCAKWLEILIS